MLLSDEELRRSPEEVLKRVLGFIGLEVSDEFVASVRAKDIGGIVKEAFPSNIIHFVTFNPTINN